jgi:hypothetical protein
MAAWIRWLDWRRALVYTHRWLGALFCALFITWFASGIVMMYARMPVLAPEERLARSAPLDLATLSFSPAEAMATIGAGAPAPRLVIGMRDGRPVYRAAGNGARTAATLAFADTGQVAPPVTLDEAVAAARRFASRGAGALEEATILHEPDQWTLQARGQLPLYRLALDDAEGTTLYVSQRTGDVVLRTTERERLWAYLGPVLHWIYFTPLRRNGSLWAEIVIWSSVLGCVVCLSGIVWGLFRYSPGARFRLRRTHRHSPYVGMMRWHHYAGLLFGTITLTWTFSGLLSMGPWNMLSSDDLPKRLGALAGPAPDLSGVTVDHLRRAAAAVAASFPARELELVTVAGEPYWVAWQAPDAAEVVAWQYAGLHPRRPRPSLDHRYVSALHPERGTFTHFDEPTLRTIAAAAMGDSVVEDAQWLTEHDAYYYDARGQRPLPVLRIRYGNAERTWLYLDPARGGVALANDRTTRRGRWLYQGLHSLDFPALYRSRPLWDVVVATLSVGGLALAMTAVWPAFKRVRRHVHGRRPPR